MVITMAKHAWRTQAAWAIAWPLYPSLHSYGHTMAYFQLNLSTIGTLQFYRLDGFPNIVKVILETQGCTK